MNKVFAAVLVASFFVPTFLFADEEKAAEQTCLREEVCFPNSIARSSQRLKIRGSSEYRYFGFRLYGAAFFAPEGAEKLEFGTYPMELKLQYYRKFEPEDFVKSGTKYIYKNPDNLPEFLEPPLQEMNRLYEEVKEGDVYSISYDPESGISLLLNDELKGQVKDAGFGRAYLGIWLDPRYSLGSKFSKRLLAGINYKV